MPRHSSIGRSRSIQDAYSIASSIAVFDFLAPAAFSHKSSKISKGRQYSTFLRAPRQNGNGCETLFFAALAQVSCCTTHTISYRSRRARRDPQAHKHRASFASAVTVRSTVGDGYSTNGSQEHGNCGPLGQVEVNRATSRADNSRIHEHGLDETISKSANRQMLQWLDRGHERPRTAVNSWFPPMFFNSTSERQFAESSKLPPDFFGDVGTLQNLTADTSPTERGDLSQTSPVRTLEDNTSEARHENRETLQERLKLLKSVRELEAKLMNARKQLGQPMEPSARSSMNECSEPSQASRQPVVLSKEDYKNLVDLYYHSYNSRFSPEATDLSPTPSFLDDHSFKLSGDFFRAESNRLNEDEDYESPLKHVHEALKSRKLKEVAMMQVFVDLLLDDESSNRALYDAYQTLPKPGVAYLPQGVIRLFLQRMSTPWTHSEKSMLRYLSLIDDMQKENIPMTVAEWSAAVYLAGRSFARVTEGDVASAFGIWQQMEKEAGVKSSHITFNILFDIAVRAGKFALAQTTLMEMSKRNLRLNRLGRVSLIYYHGLRGDGDAVRKTYRDFVDAGEIVDTLVLNCVIAALLNCKEPTAADQIYERMKSLYSRLRKEPRDDGSDAFYMRYPPPGENTIGREMASNHLGRLLRNASNMKRTLPEHHVQLQNNMPLMPDFTTFRAMFAYHAGKSGDLDRMTVLLQEMTDMFGMPLRSLVFQFLFKGFALHGPTGGPDGSWSAKRLDLCLNAFREAVKASRVTNSSTEQASQSKFQPVLPSITQVNAIPLNAPIPAFNPSLHNPPPRKRLSTWNEFVLDLAAFPRERLRRIERFHAQMFDDENTPKPHESRRPHAFVSPFFQSTVYQAPEPKLDHEEGEYVLPSPSDTTILLPAQRSQPSTNFEQIHEDNEFNTNVSSKRSYHDEEDSSDTQEMPRVTHDQFNWRSQQQVTPTRPLVCWLLRAYARNTKSRAKVEEVWGTVRRMWQPKDAMERESVVRVLRRCLRDCDREGGG